MISIDIETKCNRPGCTKSDCKHALIPHTAAITVIGSAWRSENGTIQTRVDRDLDAFRDFIAGKSVGGWNAKFDLKILRYHGVHIDPALWVDDGNLMAVASFEKVSQDYQDWYERERQRREGHRKVKTHSLKICAPYYLKVPPFWEVQDKDNDDYVIKDAVYALQLMEFFPEVLKRQGTYDFYRTHLMPWAKMFLEAECRGVRLDFPLIYSLEREATQKIETYQAALDDVWAGAYQAYRAMLTEKLEKKYSEMCEAAKRKSKNLTENKVITLNSRYYGLREARAAKLPQKLNLDSPPQLKWLLKDYLKLDIRGLDGKESTDAEVLELLAAQGRKDVQLLLDYREQQKLVHTYFASYRDFADGDILRASFNLDIARTGRTSSSNPNLQNQPGHLHRCFIARPGYKLITLDLEAIEPALIAFYSEDEGLIRRTQEGVKFHAYNAASMFQADWDLKTLKKEHPAEYDMAKEVGLSVLYGAAHRRVRICSIKRKFNWDVARSREVVQNIRGGLATVWSYKQALDDAVRAGAPVETMFGRLIPVAEDDVYMKAFNSQIQGSASDLLLQGVLEAGLEFKHNKIDAHFLMSVHDEAVFEVPAETADYCLDRIRHHLTKWELPTKYGLVPLRVEGSMGGRWQK